MRIRIVTPSAGEVQAELSEENPRTARAIWEALPIEARTNIWGDEIYFSIPVDVGAENPKEIVEMGDLGYWEPGKAFCIFFGPTPASRGEEIRPASPVNVVGRVLGDPKVFKRVRGGEKVTLERA
ncbi:MAG: cyclophilin-like fold protein [Candidatus Bathyarchaeota archaeon]|nr:cyclophilin-like fold protein [Candidatus Bathyarchaeota archaeon]MDH5790956.1 cyclophilin-like fold protein [Candidatus Bathyarchaeota archaeon]